MSRPGITYNDVANAAIQVQGQNDNPTVDRVREILGTGSKSTIARYLKDWKAKTGHTAGQESIPPELLAIVKGLWDRVKAESDQLILQHQQETDRSLTEIKQALSQTEKHNRDFQIQVHQLEEHLHQEKHLSQNLADALEAEKRGNATLSERNDRLSQQLSDQKSESERLHQLLAHVQNNLEHYQASVQQLREEQSLADEKQRAVYLQETQGLRQQISMVTEQKNLLHYNLEHVQAEITLVQNHRDTIMLEKNQFYQQLQEKIINEATLQYQCSQFKQTCLEQQQSAELKTEKLVELEKKLAVLTDQLDNIKKSLQHAQDTIIILRDEKLFLSQEKAHLEGQFKQFQVNN